MAVSGPSQWAGHAQHPLHQLVHQRCTLRSQQIAQHQHNCSVQQHCTQTTGDECTKFPRHGLALRFAAEHKGAVGAVGKQDADDVIQHIAPAVGSCVAEQLVEQRIQHNVQQGAQHAENQIAQHFPVFLDPVYHKNIPKQPRRRYPGNGAVDRIVSGRCLPDALITQRRRSAEPSWTG